MYTGLYASLPTMGEVYTGPYASLPTMGGVHWAICLPTMLGEVHLGRCLPTMLGEVHPWVYMPPIPPWVHHLLMSPVLIHLQGTPWVAEEALGSNPEIIREEEASARLKPLFL